MRKITKKLQTKMIIAVELAGWDYFKRFSFFLVSKFSELWYATFKLENSLNNIFK